MALDVPADVRDDVTGVLDGLRGLAPPGLRWSDPSRWHLTLAFLGEVPERKVAGLEERLGRAAARHRAGGLQVSGAGRFGRTVLWAGVRADNPAPGGLAPLAAAVAAAARREGIPQQDHGYRPHLTLARAGTATDLRPLVDALSGLSSRPWTVDHVRLVSSVLGARPVHTVVASFPLAAPAAPRMTAVDEELITAGLARLERERPDVHAILLDDPTVGLPPTEDLIETGLFSELEDGLLYLPLGAQEWVRSHPG